MVVRPERIAELLIDTKLGSKKFVPSCASTVDRASEIAFPSRPLTDRPLVS